MNPYTSSPANPIGQPQREPLLDDRMGSRYTMSITTLAVICLRTAATIRYWPATTGGALRRSRLFDLSPHFSPESRKLAAGSKARTPWANEPVAIPVIGGCCESCPKQQLEPGHEVFYRVIPAPDEPASKPP